MAIRDLVVPAFLSTSTVDFVVLRGMSTNPDVTGTGTGVVTFESESITRPRIKTESLTTSSLISEGFTAPQFKSETLK